MADVEGGGLCFLVLVLVLSLLLRGSSGFQHHVSCVAWLAAALGVEDCCGRREDVGLVFVSYVWFLEQCLSFFGERG